MENKTLYEFYINSLINKKTLLEFEYMMGNVYIKDLISLKENTLNIFKNKLEIIKLIHNLGLKFNFEEDKKIVTKDDKGEKHIYKIKKYVRQNS